MNSGLYTAYSGLIVRYDTLNTIANNLANVNSNGYKEDKLFYKLYNNAVLRGSGNPVEEAVNNGVFVESGGVNFSDGILTETGNNLDMALVGKGFFAVQTSNGIRYTRNGNFTVDSTRKLITREGFPVLGEDGKPIALPNGQINIDARGEISDDGTPVGKIKIVDFTNYAELSKEGNSLLKLVSPNSKETTPNDVEIRQGFVEKSNVDPIKATVDMVEGLRQFQFLTKSIEMIMNEVNLRVIDQVGRT